MPDFRANIAHYKDLLVTETDPRKISMLRKLLEEEERKLTDWQAKNPKRGRRSRARLFPWRMIGFSALRLSPSAYIQSR